MNIEKIQEPISVLASFAGGGLSPLRFQWHGRTYKVEAVNGKWIDRQGDLYSLNYSVQCDGQTYYVHFSSGDVQWRLDQLITE
jgi:hypothetical protein